MIDNVKQAEAAHNTLANTDEEYGRMSAYIKMAPYYLKLIKAKEYMEYIDGLDATTVELEILEAKRETWQREVEIWRTISANQRR
jgi:hypothetical protein